MVFFTLLHWLRPTIDAFTKPNIPWEYRWRLLVLQPIALLTYTLKALPWTFSKAYTVEWIPTRSGKIRTLVFRPQPTKSSQPQDGNEGPASKRLSPIHLDIHGGAFIGGLPEYEASFSSALAQRSGAVVISPGYRYSPAHPFPAAIDDIDDIVDFIVTRAEERWGADPCLMTVGGFSAGGNLALACCQNAKVKMLGSVTFYASIDLRLPPIAKPKPPTFPKTDPMAVLLPLFDSYPSASRSANMENPRLSPIVARIDKLPQDMLLIIAGIDILLHEQLTFVERVKKDFEEEGIDEGERKIVGKVYEKGFHGWLELPFNIMKTERDQVYGEGINFLVDTYKKHGWSYQHE